MGDFLEVLEFADGIRCHSFCVFLLYFNLFDSDENGGISSEMSEIHVGISSFSELLT